MDPSLPLMTDYPPVRPGSENVVFVLIEKDPGSEVYLTGLDGRWPVDTCDVVYDGSGGRTGPRLPTS